MRASAAALGAAGLLLLAGCSAFPDGLASRSPSVSPSPSGTPVSGSPFGDVAPREQLTDELGTYLHVTLSPEAAAALAVDPATVDGSIAGSSWDDAALLEAQRFVATFVAEQTIDSTALDRDLAGWEEWRDQTAPQYFAEEFGKTGSAADRPVPIFNDPDDFTPRLIRDGFARLDDATITIESLANEPREGGEWLTVTGSADVMYRLADEQAIEALVQQGYDREAAESIPDLADGEPGHYIVLLDWSYSVERVGDGWTIRDYDLVWEATIEGVAQA
jgi:hypothetical protein